MTLSWELAKAPVIALAMAILPWLRFSVPPLVLIGPPSVSTPVLPFFTVPTAPFDTVSPWASVALVPV